MDSEEPEDIMPIAQRILSSIILAITLYASWLGCSYFQTPNVYQHEYPFGVPFIVAVVACSLAGVVAVIRNTLVASLVQDALVAVSFVFVVLAAVNCPRGDDWTSLGIVFGIGPPLLFAMGLAIISTLIVIALRRRTQALPGR